MAQVERTCHRCDAVLGIDDDICQSCGASNPLSHPWYIWPVGAVIVLILFALLADVEGIWRYLQAVLE